MNLHFKKYFSLLLLLFPFCLNAQNLFWIDGVSKVIQTDKFSGFNFVDVDTSVGAAFGIAADIFNNKLFWVDNSARTIMSSNLDGSNAQIIFTPSGSGITIPRGIAVDAKNKIIFWTDNGSRSLMKANYDGSGATVLDTGLDSPGFVAYDSVGEKIYWADNGLFAKKIQRCSTDGTNIQDVATDLNQVWGIAIDDHTQTIYWIDSGVEKIQNGNLAATLPVLKKDVITNLTGSQRGLVLDEKSNMMYWSSTDGKILEASLDGTNETVVDSGLIYPQGITLADSLLTISGVQNNAALPLHYELLQNYPNPFNPSTIIAYQIAKSGHVSLKIYDLLGREVKTLVNETKKPGNYKIEFNADNLPSGIYFYKIASNGYSSVKKMILLK